MIKTGEWAAARAATTAMAERFDRAHTMAARAEAQLFRALVVKAFTTKGRSNGKAWTPNAPSTVRQKGSAKPLIDSGQLRASVAVVERGRQTFIGIPSKKKRSGGGPLVDIAAVHEFGKVIVQQRKGEIVIIKIPKRSFIQATADAHFAPTDVRTRFFARVAINMGGAWAVAAPPTARQLAKSKAGG